ncbi:carboxypeptidase regulatory-like domain-containing protein [Anaeromyxobacter oryzisoli]|uniref:carboxypeptidase regulatory-like domain-containing protein n=1 Tax=Anaeromyxobacter oryzisoli TaxID=2925408 RepID=UPI001F56300F|nr:carboxypeptidase regulatory-like domain-containing protein [Anaeromyxobacter sp. SG63]
MTPRAHVVGRLVALLAPALGALPALAQTGSITGKVEATPAKYLAETVVYVKHAPGTFPPKTESMDQRALTFIPHVLVITKGDTVRFLNHDTVAHNVYSPDGEAYNLGTFKPNEERTHKFEKEGAYSQLCSIHPEMLGYIYVNQNPYAAAVDAKGRYTIKNVPPGSYQLVVWNPKLKAPEKPITVTAGKAAEANFAIKR